MTSGRLLRMPTITTLGPFFGIASCDAMLWKKKPPESHKAMLEIKQHVQDLARRFSGLEQSLEEVRTNATHITIENVHIHQPVLEKMEYRLDHLDIEQLSGSLNLGNNFGAKLRSGMPSAPTEARSNPDSRVPPAAHPAPKRSEGAFPDLERTLTGYRITKN